MSLRANDTLRACASEAIHTIRKIQCHTLNNLHSNAQAHTHTHTHTHTQTQTQTHHALAVEPTCTAAWMENTMGMPMFSAIVSETTALSSCIVLHASLSSPHSSPVGFLISTTGASSGYLRRFIIVPMNVWISDDCKLAQRGT